MKTAIYSLTRGDPRIEFVGSLFPLLKRADVSHLGLHPTLYLHHGRSECTMDFLANDYGDWMMFIDDDTQFTMEAIDTLFAIAQSGGPAVYGGIYWSPNRGTTDPTNDVFPVVFNHQAGDRDSPYSDTWVHKPFPRQWTADQTAPFLCDAVGTGFMMIHRSVLTTMKSRHPGPLHWFDMDTIDGVATGEDLTFCHRAKKLGYDIVAVPLPQDSIYHVKAVKIRRPDSSVQ